MGMDVPRLRDQLDKNKLLVNYHKGGVKAAALKFNKLGIILKVIEIP
jgi:hypothetical protein